MAEKKEPEITGIEIKVVDSKEAPGKDESQRTTLAGNQARDLVGMAKRIETLFIKQKFTVSGDSSVIEQAIANDYSGKTESRMQINFLSGNKVVGGMAEFEITPESVKKAIDALDSAASQGVSVYEALATDKKVKPKEREIKVMSTISGALRDISAISR